MFELTMDTRPDEPKRYYTEFDETDLQDKKECQRIKDLVKRSTVHYSDNADKQKSHLDMKTFYNDPFQKQIEDYATQSLLRNHVLGLETYMYSPIPKFSNHAIPDIKNVIFNDPATIVFWSDGTKTVVKCQDDDRFDPEKGLAMAICKKVFGNKGRYCNQLKKWLPKEEDKYVEYEFHVTTREDFEPLLEYLGRGITITGIEGDFDTGLIFHGRYRTEEEDTPNWSNPYAKNEPLWDQIAKAFSETGEAFAGNRVI